MFLELGGREFARHQPADGIRGQEPKPQNRTLRHGSAGDEILPASGSILKQRLRRREKVRTMKIRTSKAKKNIEMHQSIRSSKVSIKVIRMLKVILIRIVKVYQWWITYGYQGLWGVRLGSVRLG